MLNGWFPQAMTNDNLRIELGLFAVNEGKTPPPIKFQDINAKHVGFHVRNIETVYARAKANGAITVSDITFEQGHSDIPGAGLAVNWCPLCQPFSGNPVTITHSIFRENMSSDDCGGLFAQSGPLVSVSHSLFADNTSGMTEGGAACLDARGGFTQFYGNTVVQNTAASGAGATGGLLCGQSGPCDIDDNIFWQNSGFGLDLESSGSVLLYNDFGGRTGQAPSLEIGDVSENPNFVDFAGGNYHLSSASPLLALSNVLLDGVDLQGNPYPTGGRQDLGAFEETVYIDGFDGP
jgi:hypothetical protein